MINISRRAYKERGLGEDMTLSIEIGSHFSYKNPKYVFCSNFHALTGWLIMLEAIKKHKVERPNSTTEQDQSERFFPGKGYAVAKIHINVEISGYHTNIGKHVLATSK